MHIDRNQHDGPITTLCLFRFPGLAGRLWAFSQMVFARPYLARIPGIGFWKLFGSGTGEGFTPVPNTAVWGILATWPSLAAAEEGLKAPVFRRYRARAGENWTLFLQTTSVRGSWSQSEPFAVTTKPAKGSLAALTRATIRPRILLKFWQRVPSISAAIGSDPNVAFKIGLGEVPWFHQVTFSIWPDTESMAKFARKDGPHARAITAVRDGKWFAEELYARFHIVGAQGSWNGADPLADLKGTVPA
ncbi:MAG: spheroidene monooxygenase [Pseudomonadota bacterium]